MVIVQNSTIQFLVLVCNAWWLRVAYLGGLVVCDAADWHVNDWLVGAGSWFLGANCFFNPRSLLLYWFGFNLMLLDIEYRYLVSLLFLPRTNRFTIWCHYFFTGFRMKSIATLQKHVVTRLSEVIMIIHEL
jgi:hypothetical protein